MLTKPSLSWSHTLNMFFTTYLIMEFNTTSSSFTSIEAKISLKCFSVHAFILHNDQRKNLPNTIFLCFNSSAVEFIETTIQIIDFNTHIARSWVKVNELQRTSSLTIDSIDIQSSSNSSSSLDSSSELDNSLLFQKLYLILSNTSADLSFSSFSFLLVFLRSNQRMREMAPTRTNQIPIHSIHPKAVIVATLTIFDCIIQKNTKRTNKESQRIFNCLFKNIHIIQREFIYLHIILILDDMKSFQFSLLFIESDGNTFSSHTSRSSRTM